MDKLVLAQKLESLRRCVTRVEEKLPASAQKLVNDADLQDVIVLDLTRAVQLCTDIATHIISESSERPPTTMSEAFLVLEKVGVIDTGTIDNRQISSNLRNRLLSIPGCRLALNTQQGPTLSCSIIFSIDDAKEALRLMNQATKIDASGNIPTNTIDTLISVRPYFTASWALTKHLKAVDLSMRTSATNGNANTYVIRGND